MQRLNSRSTSYKMSDCLSSLLTTSHLRLFLFICISFSGVSALHFVTSNQDLVVLEGEDVTLLCTVTEREAWQVLGWKRNETVLSMDARLFMDPTSAARFELQAQGDDYNLLIRNVTATDDDVYVCNIASSQETRKSKLTVQVPSRITMFPDEDNTVYEDSILNTMRGATLYLECRAEGNPSPTVEWHHQDKKHAQSIETPGFSSLSIDQIDATDSGLYVCKADNGVLDPVEKELVVNVQYEPSVESSLTLVHVGLGDDVTIDCSIQANPPASVTWTHNETIIDASRTNVKTISETDETEFTADLTIVQLQVDDVGAYVCEAVNKLGTHSHEITLCGLPYDLSITGETESFYSDEYTVKWTVRSNSQLDDFNIWLKRTHTLEQTFSTADPEYEEYEANNELPNDAVPELVEATDPEYLEIAVPAPAKHKDPQYQLEYSLRSLTPSSTYTIVIRAQNVFGSTQSTEPFTFNTAQDGNPAPPPTSTILTTTTETDQAASAHTNERGNSGSGFHCFHIAFYLTMTSLICLRLSLG